MNTDECNITKHAEKRIRKRLGVPRSAVRKIVEEAREKGYGMPDFTGSMRKYLDYIYFRSDTPADHGIVHNEFLFLFRGKSLHTLITVIPLEPRFRGVKPKT